MDKSGDNGGITAGAEVWIASEHPQRFAGRYAHVIEVDPLAEEALVSCGRGRVAWVPVSALVPAYGGEL